MLFLHDIGYTHPNRDLLFTNINLYINKHDKIALIGNNGAGKSTLLQLLAGQLQPSAGTVKADSQPYYIPQLFGQYNSVTIAQALKIEGKLKALQEILAGNVTDENLALLDDDWSIEERCIEAFAYWKLEDINLSQPMQTLSGGQKARVFLAGILIHQPEVVLLDEPSNHLDAQSRGILYDYIKNTGHTLIIVSHDRTLLNLLNKVCELSKRGLVYGGNYEFYAEQKLIEGNALQQDLKSKEKALRKAKETEKEAIERQQKLDARGKKKQEKAGLPTISMNTLRNNAEKSTARLKGVHAEKIGAISQELQSLRSSLPEIDKMKVNLDSSALHKGKVLVAAKDINFGYDNGQLLWQDGLSFQITSGGRIAIKGLNGSGKSTLIKIILGEFQPTQGTIERAGAKTIYIDQDYSLINNSLSVYEQALEFNSGALQEHDIKMRLNRFLFTPDYWDKPCRALSGGEKMRLMLCCLTIGSQAPDIIILDEPTNNLDIQNLKILTAAIIGYQGTLIVVSHDEYFLKETGIENSIELY